MILAGLDPSLSNFGMVRGEYLNGLFVPDRLQLVETKPDSSAKSVRKNSQDLERCRSIYKAMSVFLEPADIVCVEIPIGSQSARAMASYGACIGLLSSIQKPLIQILPAEVKLTATNSKTASKAQMIAWAPSLYPDLPWSTTTRNGTRTFSNKNEHLADAIAAVHAAMETDYFKSLTAFATRKVVNF